MNGLMFQNENENERQDAVMYDVVYDVVYDTEGNEYLPVVTDDDDVEEDGILDGEFEFHEADAVMYDKKKKKKSFLKTANLLFNPLAQAKAAGKKLKKAFIPTRKVKNVGKALQTVAAAAKQNRVEQPGYRPMIAGEGNALDSIFGAGWLDKAIKHMVTMGTIVAPLLNIEKISFLNDEGFMLRKKTEKELRESFEVSVAGFLEKRDDFQRSIGVPITMQIQNSRFFGAVIYGGGSKQVFDKFPPRLRVKPIGAGVDFTPYDFRPHIYEKATKWACLALAVKFGQGSASNVGTPTFEVQTFGTEIITNSWIGTEGLNIRDLGANPKGN